ncbi:hypothetical protein DICA0_D15434 [Diutina catenulata]
MEPVLANHSDDFPLSDHEKLVLRRVDGPEPIPVVLFPTDIFQSVSPQTVAISVFKVCQRVMNGEIDPREGAVHIPDLEGWICYYAKVGSEPLEVIPPHPGRWSVGQEEPPQLEVFVKEVERHEDGPGIQPVGSIVDL